MTSAFDVEITALTEPWIKRWGPPTCGPGCSRCCERMTVLTTAPEALALARNAADWVPAWRDRIRELEDWIDAADAPEEARDALLDQGPCVFLADQRCGVYEHRPDSCRACLVWHEPWYCGRTDWDMTTPAELNALRIERMYGRMLAEVDAGRKPFWGYLLPAVWAADRFGEAYLDGEDVRPLLDPRWTETELIEFPSRKRLTGELKQHRRTARKGARPWGQPRGADVASRTELRPRPAT